MWCKSAACRPTHTHSTGTLRTVWHRHSLSNCRRATSLFYHLSAQYSDVESVVKQHVTWLMLATTSDLLSCAIIMYLTSFTDKAAVCPLLGAGTLPTTLSLCKRLRTVACVAVDMYHTVCWLAIGCLLTDCATPLAAAGHSPGGRSSCSRWWSRSSWSPTPWPSRRSQGCSESGSPRSSNVSCTLFLLRPCNVSVACDPPAENCFDIGDRNMAPSACFVHEHFDL